MKLIKKIFSKHKKINIEFCQKNLDRFLSEDQHSDYNTFLNSNKVIYTEYECQSKCRECKASPYAIVDGQFVSADDSKELLEKLLSYTGGK
ncbi:DUF1450 domain-containing protein [Bacillus sp. AK128]